MANASKSGGVPHHVMVIDTNRCVGCWTCAVACKEINNEPLGFWWNRILTTGPNQSSSSAAPASDNIDVPRGTYPDVVGLLQGAVRSDVLASRFSVDAVPQAGRSFDRIADEEALVDANQPEGVVQASATEHVDSDSEGSEVRPAAAYVADNPVPDLFAQPKEPSEKKKKKKPSQPGETDEAESKSKKSSGRWPWFGKI